MTTFNPNSITKSLSSAALETLLASAKIHCRQEWGNVNDPPCHPEDNGWKGCRTCIDAPATAATLRVAVDQADSLMKRCGSPQQAEGRSDVFDAFREIATELEGLTSIPCKA
jgi:hypothetical protein